MSTQKVRTFLWYDNQAEAAANLYTSLFPNSKVTKIVRNPPGGPGPEGTALTVEFELDGIQYIALNGGPHFQFTEAISLSVDCESQAEINRLWDKLLEGGGSPSQCGWLKDRFGLSWQIVPSVLGKLLSDPKRGRQVFQAMMPMAKLDIQKLQDAFDGK